MSRYRSAFKLAAISILLATALCVFINYLRGSGELVSTHQPHFDQLFMWSLLPRKILSLSKLQSYHLFNSDANSSKVNKSVYVFSWRDNYLRQLKKANITYVPPTLTFQSIEDVKTFVFFIGYPRSGHSIIASMIDAHPNAILAHEFNLFEKLATQLSTGHEYLLNKSNLFNMLYLDSYTEAVAGWRSGKSNFDKKGYSLKLNTSQSWQGKFSTLKVIGDKAGGRTSRLYRDHPKQFLQIYSSLVDAVRVPVRVIHVVRNPFDMIATRLLYSLSNERRQKAQFNSTYKLKDDKLIYQAIYGLYGEVKAVYSMIRASKLTVLEVHNVDLVNDPRKEMKSVCQFIGLNCSKSYLEMCEQVTYKHISRTRDAVEWSKQMKRLVERCILSFPFFQRYRH